MKHKNLLLILLSLIGIQWPLPEAIKVSASLLLLSNFSFRQWTKANVCDK